MRGLSLPAALISLLETRGWLPPGPRVLHDVIPWFADPLMFMADLHDMRLQNKALDSIADNSSLSSLFRITRASQTGRDLDLPWLDADQAVLIAVNEHAGDDVALALDYRTDAANPRVVASDIWSDATQHSWRIVTPTFTDLLAAFNRSASTE
ncbi:hypothetical protein [Hamadaea tsunoensis]|uniref:hypothetical protein n=1 Tax=Hamadaea tsunoensis TaxID=53368 RepID=UPI0004892574|nr:hypothetical protein [Hamadaea tsunoensis]